ncbi:PspC domain-containing protein [Cohnella cholangitidis]|uniref:PspC domain-containing protein n=1 Tax=Cohnella cholangitidis TaxID=2598458 RepID=A0A7G5BVN0_9BACL|nr:PspC domain-containing protein [Cohnella cholangitidis]QMV41014.1 PspC domain-containing protein [Cohnella cholangitidis]
MRKLYRSTRDRKLFGVCGGLADYLGVDATLLRILLIVVAVFSAGSVIVVYIIAGFVIPREPNYGGGFGTNPYDQGWRGQEQSQYGYGNQNQNWTPNSNSYTGPGPGAHAGTGYSNPSPQRPAPFTASAQSSPQSSQGIDAMMEDIEKKSLQREIEELKARISKFEKQSKGE